MDYGGLPPEVNSARMYAGPGSGSMQAAASAWDALAAELRSSAASYWTIVSELADETWQGPSSAAMEDAATPWVTWLNTTAEQAEQSATQARAAANAYQTAFASVVPPEVVMANRIQLAQLTATNTFGQNTPAIAMTETEYGDMWAQDALAMYSYAGNSATASTLAPFAPAPSTTNAAGSANQSAAVAQAAGTSASSGAQSVLSQLSSSITASLHGLAAPASSASSSASLSSVLSKIGNAIGLSSSSAASAGAGVPGLSASSIVADVENYIGLFGLFMGLDAMGPLMGTPISTAITQAMQPVAAAVPAVAAPAIAAPAAIAAGAAGGALGGGFAGGFGGLGAAASVGALSVPPSWAMAATPPLLGSLQVASAFPELAGAQGLPPLGVPLLPNGAGQAVGVAAAAGVGGAVASKYGPRLKVLSRSPGAGYSENPMMPAAAYGVPGGLPQAPGYTPHIVYLPNNPHNSNGHNGHNGHNGNSNGHNGNGHNGNGKH